MASLPVAAPLPAPRRILYTGPPSVPVAPPIHLGPPAVPTAGPRAAPPVPVAPPINLAPQAVPAAGPRAAQIAPLPAAVVAVAAVAVAAGPAPVAPGAPVPDNNERINDLVHASVPVRDVMSFFQSYGLLSNPKPCPTCRTPMELNYDSRACATSDKHYCICHNNECEKRYSTKSIRNGTVFEGSKLTLKKWLEILHEFARRTTASQSSKLVGASLRTVTLMFQTFRDFISQHFEANPIQLGGPGKVCQIDESCFGHKRKHGRGR